MVLIAQVMRVRANEGIRNSGLIWRWSTWKGRRKWGNHLVPLIFSVEASNEPLGALRSHGLVLQLGRVSFFILWQHFNISHANIYLGAGNELDSSCIESPTWNKMAWFSAVMNAPSPSKKEIEPGGSEHQLCKRRSEGCCVSDTAVRS